MKAYRFESREEPKWQWGFWALYCFILLHFMMFTIITGERFAQIVASIFVILMLLIVYVDFVGHKIRKSYLWGKRK